LIKQYILTSLISKPNPEPQTPKLCSL